LVAAVRDRGVAKKPRPVDPQTAEPLDTPSEELLDRLRSLGYVE
jgi:hypothetical protein